MSQASQAAIANSGGGVLPPLVTTPLQAQRKSIAETIAKSVNARNGVPDQGAPPRPKPPTETPEDDGTPAYDPDKPATIVMTAGSAKPKPPPPQRREAAAPAKRMTLADLTESRLAKRPEAQTPATAPPKGPRLAPARSGVSLAASVVGMMNRKR